MPTVKFIQYHEKYVYDGTNSAEILSIMGNREGEPPAILSEEDGVLTIHWPNLPSYPHVVIYEGHLYGPFDEGSFPMPPNTVLLEDVLNS